VAAEVNHGDTPPAPPSLKISAFFSSGYGAAFAVSVANKGVICRYKTIKELAPAVGRR